MDEKIGSKGDFWRIAIFIIALGLVSLLVFQFMLAQGLPAKKNCEGPEIGIFRTQLALVPSSDLAERKNVEGKIKAWETMIAICESVTSAPATGLPNVMAQFTPATLPPFEIGIFEGQTGTFHSFEAKIENHWKGIVNENRVIVFAGAWISDPSQGFLAVQTAPSKGQAIWGYYPSATKSGALRIINARGSRLIIQQANDKKVLFFDVPALSFVNSLDEVVASGTPPGTYLSTQLPYPLPEQTLEDVHHPLCQFNGESASEIAKISLDDYVFSEPQIVHVSPRNIQLVGWLPDNQSVLLTRDNSDQNLQTIELFNPGTGESQTYVERQNVLAPPVWIPGLRPLYIQI